MSVEPKMVREQQPTTVEIPAAIAEEANRIANQQHWTLHHAILYLVNRGIKAQRETDISVTKAYDALMGASPEEQDEAGKALIRSVFGPASVA